MNRGKSILALVAVVIVGLVALLAWPDRDKKSDADAALVLHCAAGLRLPVSAIVASYEKETGRKVQLNFGPSGALEAALEVAGGDLFLPADRSYIDSTKSKGLVDEVLPVAYLTAGVAVAKGNPRQVDALDDLTAQGVKVVLANPF